MSIADGFILVGWMAASYLLLMLFLRPSKFSYQELEEDAMRRQTLFAYAGAGYACPPDSGAAARRGCLYVSH